MVIKAVANIEFPIPINISDLHDLFQESWSRSLIMKLSMKVGVVARPKWLSSLETKAYSRPHSPAVVKTTGHEVPR